jgi:hypothetical protein
MNTWPRCNLHFWRLVSLVAVVVLIVGCRGEERRAANNDTPPGTQTQAQLLEPPGHAPGEPHPFIECPDGACPREQPAYLFSGDGNARPATLVRDDARGIWTSPGYHSEGTFERDGRFVLRFADGGAWVFKSAVEAARSEIRRLAQNIDRNGNVIELSTYYEYDVLNEMISHNINAIGDKKINGNKMYSKTEVQQLAKRKPGVASWNAANYDEYARSR